MKYTITKIERKDYNGSLYLKVDVVDEAGVETKNASIWEKGKDGVFPNFESIVLNTQIQAKPYTNAKGYITLYPDMPRASTGQTGGNKGAMASKMMDKKAENIKEAQENRGYGVMVASTIRIAAECALEEYKAHGDSKFSHGAKTLSEAIIKWRHWVVQNWENVSQKKVANTDIDYPENTVDEPPF